MKKIKKPKTHFREEVCFRYDVAVRQGFAVSRKRESHGKNLLCKLTLDGAFSLAIDIKFWLRRVLASKPPPIEKSTLVPCFRFEMVGGRVLPFPASGNPTARICFAN